MNRPPSSGQFGQTQLVRVPGWAVAIGAIVAGALGLAVFIASAGLLLMLAPIAIGMVFYVRWRIRRALRKMADVQRAYQGDVNDGIIDVEYRVIDGGDDRRHR